MALGLMFLSCTTTVRLSQLVRVEPAVRQATAVTCQYLLPVNLLSHCFLQDLALLHKQPITWWQ